MVNAVFLTRHYFNYMVSWVSGREICMSVFFLYLVLVGVPVNCGWLSVLYSISSTCVKSFLKFIIFFFLELVCLESVYKENLKAD